MRIAYVCADAGVPVFGRKGCSIHVQEVLRALRAQGARIELFAARRGGEWPRGLRELRVHDLPAPAGEGSARERAALTANRDLRAALEDAGPFDLVYERYSLWSFAAMQYALERGVPGLLEVNAPLIEEQRSYRGLVDVAAAEAVAALAFGAARAILAVSDEVASYVEARPEGRGRVHVVPNGVDPQRFGFAPRRAGRDAARPYTVGFVGSLKPWHGLGTLADAFARLCRRADARLLVVGDGPERMRLLADLAAGGVEDRAELTGAVDPDEVPALLTRMDAAVAPYPAGGSYFSPLKVFEYMAAGVPVVASRVGQLGALIDDGVSGLLVPPDDAGALCLGLERLMASPALAASLSRAARERVLREGTWEGVARRILELAGCRPAVLLASGTGV